MDSAKQKIRHYERLAMLVIGLVLAYLYYYFSMTYLETQYGQQLQQEAEQAVKKIDQVSLEAIALLDELNSADTVQCDDELLLNMRKHLFESDYVKDIGFFQDDKLVCTTGVGLLPTPYINPPADFNGPNGESIWVDVELLLFESKKKAIILKKGSYNVVVERNHIEQLNYIGSQWELIFKVGQELKTLSGNKGSYLSYLQNNNTLDYRYSTFLCSKNNPYCVFLSDDGKNFKVQYNYYFNSIYALCFLITFITYVFLQSRLKRYRSLRNRILRGIKNDAFYCLYQPIVELSTSKIIGCEVLARYRDKEGMLFPDMFIPEISKQGLSWEFSKVIVNKALSEVIDSPLNNADFKLNINFFAQDIASKRILELKDNPTLTSAKFKFVIEVTESEELSSDDSSDVLSALANTNGFEVAIDDFGTGYSNLNQIKKFSCHSLKIDRSFVNEMEGGSVRSTLIPHIIDIANKIKVDVVAEGIENSMQQKALIEAGVGYGQGWMFGKPMTIEKLVRLISKIGEASPLKS